MSTTSMSFKCQICRNDYLMACYFQMLVSPVLAGLAVAIGVPILLFYVYGVVPGT